MKIRLAICLSDQVYQERFVKCVIKHYAKRYEVHSFENETEFLEYGIDKFDVVLMDEQNRQTADTEESVYGHVLWLKEEDKYREVYRIMESVELQVSQQEGVRRSNAKERLRVFGVYSFEQPAAQLPFCVLLNEILGEECKVVFLDLQEYSGFGEEGDLGLEDLMAMAVLGHFHRGRLQSAVGHMSDWDYVVPVKLSKCLLEGKKEMFEQIIGQLTEELGYDTIVLNLGSIVLSQEGVADLCDRMFLLDTKDVAGEWRLQQFAGEAERKGEQSVLHRIQRIEIPSISGEDKEWRRLCERWRWSNLGSLLRKIVAKEKPIGEVM